MTFQSEADFVIQEIQAHGRKIVIKVSENLDEYGQFEVAIVIDGLQKYSANFNNRLHKEEEKYRACLSGHPCCQSFPCTNLIRPIQK